MSTLMGKLIAIEGLEGAGKSTAVHTVIDLLSKLNIKSIITREPGGTAVGEILRAVIKNPEYKEVLDDKSELLLLYTSRIQLVEQVIKPALRQGLWVVADRFELSTLAYQGGGRGLDLNMIKRLSAFCLRGFKPDLTVYLNITPELGMQRARLRGAFDRIEQQSIDFFYRVYEAYTQQIKTDTNIIIIDASRSLDEMQHEIQKAVNQFIEHAV